MGVQNEYNDRLKKLEKIKKAGINPYADKYLRSHSLSDARGLEMGQSVSLAGRVVLMRDMGKIAFVHLLDWSGRLQAVLRIGDLDKEAFKKFMGMVDIGDFIGIDGEMFTTQKGEVSVLAKNFKLLSKALRPLPEKWSGIQDTEAKYRQRYLDLISNEETRERFKFKSDFVRELRDFYHENGFIEIDTPVLGNTASGALAKPFKTHYNSLDTDVYLRIAPEIHLKEAVIGGFERVFEIARVFRNEGMDPSHLQDFSMVEHYAAYWDFRDNMDFIKKLLTTIIMKLKGGLEVDIIGRGGDVEKIDFGGQWPVVSFRDLLIADCGIDIDKFATSEELRAEIKNKKINIENIDKLGRGNLIDALYKEVSRPKLKRPTFLVNHPIDVSPLARRNDADPNVVDRFQLLINGWEVVNAYSELIDPEDQKERFEKQAQAKAAGDDEAMGKDDEFVKALEYGMPPTSGLGMGIERIVALLTCQPNLRDVVLFPLLKPRE